MYECGGDSDLNSLLSHLPCITNTMSTLQAPSGSTQSLGAAYIAPSKDSLVTEGVAKVQLTPEQLKQIELNRLKGMG
jgi:hypothetical protein